MAEKRSMPKREKIFDHWATKIADEFADKYYLRQDVKAADHPMLTSICFACGTPTETQRSHILPKNKGGGDEIDNLHLLCRECHNESEFYSGKTYWEWFASKNESNSGSFARVLSKRRFFIEALQKEGIEGLKERGLLDFWNEKDIDILRQLSQQLTPGQWQAIKETNLLVYPI